MCGRSLKMASVLNAARILTETAITLYAFWFQKHYLTNIKAISKRKEGIDFCEMTSNKLKH